MDDEPRLVCNSCRKKFRLLIGGKCDGCRRGKPAAEPGKKVTLRLGYETDEASGDVRIAKLPVGKRTSQPTPGVMNKTEARYAERLETLRLAGEVLWYAFESVKLRLADRTHYTPDFIVMMADGTTEFHEVKGFWRDDARVKIKIAAELYPFRFLAVRRVKGDWEFERFGR